MQKLQKNKREKTFNVKRLRGDNNTIRKAEGGQDILACKRRRGSKKGGLDRRPKCEQKGPCWYDILYEAGKPFWVG